MALHVRGTHAAGALHLALWPGGKLVTSLPPIPQSRHCAPQAPFFHGDVEHPWDTSNGHPLKEAGEQQVHRVVLLF
jgi:hypothetical protein